MNKYDSRTHLDRLINALHEYAPTLRWAPLRGEQYMPAKWHPAYYLSNLASKSELLEKIVYTVNFGTHDDGKHFVLSVDGKPRFIFADSIPKLITKAELLGMLDD